MINILSWNSMKNCIDNNPGLTYYWSIENDICSNDPNIQDYDRYWIRLKIDDQENDCFIRMESPPSADQTDWEDNYKSGGVETL